jgi:hypothetical protein
VCVVCVFIHRDKCVGMREWVGGFLA